MLKDFSLVHIQSLGLAFLCDAKELDDASEAAGAISGDMKEKKSQR